MIKNWLTSDNRELGVFHFKNSLQRWIAVEVDATGLPLFINLDTCVGYSLKELKREGMFFYTDPEDPNFLGVKLAEE